MEPQENNKKENKKEKKQKPFFVVKECTFPKLPQDQDFILQLTYNSYGIGYANAFIQSPECFEFIRDFIGDYETKLNEIKEAGADAEETKKKEIVQQKIYDNNDMFKQLGTTLTERFDELVANCVVRADLSDPNMYVFDIRCLHDHTKTWKLKARHVQNVTTRNEASALPKQKTTDKPHLLELEFNKIKEKYAVPIEYAHYNHGSANAFIVFPGCFDFISHEERVILDKIKEVYNKEPQKVQKMVNEHKDMFLTLGKKLYDRFEKLIQNLVVYENNVPSCEVQNGNDEAKELIWVEMKSAKGENKWRLRTANWKKHQGKKKQIDPQPYLHAFVHSTEWLSLDFSSITFNARNVPRNSLINALVLYTDCFNFLSEEQKNLLRNIETAKNDKQEVISSNEEEINKMVKTLRDHLQDMIRENKVTPTSTNIRMIWWDVECAHDKNKKWSVYEWVRFHDASSPPFEASLDYDIIRYEEYSGRFLCHNKVRKFCFRIDNPDSIIDSCVIAKFHEYLNFMSKDQKTQMREFSELSELCNLANAKEEFECNCKLRHFTVYHKLYNSGTALALINYSDSFSFVKEDEKTILKKIKEHMDGNEYEEKKEPERKKKVQEMIEKNQEMFERLGKQVFQYFEKTIAECPTTYVVSHNNEMTVRFQYFKKERDWQIITTDTIIDKETKGLCSPTSECDYGHAVLSVCRQSEEDQEFLIYHNWYNFGSAHYLFRHWKDFEKYLTEDEQRILLSIFVAYEDTPKELRKEKIQPMIEENKKLFDEKRGLVVDHMTRIICSSDQTFIIEAGTTFIHHFRHTNGNKYEYWRIFTDDGQFLNRDRPDGKKVFKVISIFKADAKEMLKYEEPLFLPGTVPE